MKMVIINILGPEIQKDMRERKNKNKERKKRKGKAILESRKTKESNRI